MKIINNPLTTDYHIHSNTFSDGMSDIDAIVAYAKIIGLERIAITDHSRAVSEHYKEKKTPRGIVSRWRNVHNDVDVSFGIEGDILNLFGDVCVDIAKHRGKPLILSLHKEVYGVEMSEVTQAYIRAIEKNFSEITMLGHIHLKESSKFLDIESVIKLVNRHAIPLEINCGAIVRELSNEEILEQILLKTDRCYINSDAHTLNEMRDNKVSALVYLKKRFSLNI
ncbi:hypothetical protein J4436_01595 [Candidatus Woesearchaeota archaeon]|nr:hypothetical protein [Candidatus Woesearchaeota archaeon]